MPRTDIVHFGLMLTAMAFAYLLPFELILLSYAVLGPLHYLTEISWLHDRGYFLPARSIGLILACICVAAFYLASPSWLGFVLWVAFLAGALLVAKIGPFQRAVLVVVASLISAALLTQTYFFFLVAILLPSLVHVSVFTLVFMAVGAHRAGSKVQWLMLALYLAIVAFILIVPPVRPPIAAHSLALDQSYFGNITLALGILLRSPKLAIDGRVAGLLSFVYTYHYLNWFLKAEVIGWRRIPRWRLAAVTTLGLSATGLYLYDYALGIAVLLTLSLTHVVLEFPLNAVSLRQLAGIAGRGVARRIPAYSLASD